MWRQIAILVVSAVLCGCERTAGHYISAAELSGARSCRASNTFEVDRTLSTEDVAWESKKKENRALLLGGHCVRAGGGVVLRYVTLQPGMPGVSDGEEYTQLTVSIPSLPAAPGETKSFGLANGDFYFSVTGPWFDKGYGLYAAAGSGEVQLRRIDSKRVAFQATLVVDAKNARDGASNKLKLSKSGLLEEAAIDDLSGCLGLLPACPIKEK